MRERVRVSHLPSGASIPNWFNLGKRKHSKDLEVNNYRYEILHSPVENTIFKNTFALQRVVTFTAQLANSRMGKTRVLLSAHVPLGSHQQVYKVLGFETTNQKCVCTTVNLCLMQWKRNIYDSLFSVMFGSFRSFCVVWWTFESWQLWTLALLAWWLMCN